MSASTTLVTGGAGFIGSHLCRDRLDRGDHVVCVDNFDPYYSVSRKRANIASLNEDEKFVLVEADVRDGAVIRELAGRYGVNRIAHLAARPGVRSSLESPVEYFDINVTGTIQILEAARQAGIRDIVIASSSSVYGTDAPAPYEEDFTDLRPVSPYAASKRAMEVAAVAHAAIHGLNVVCLRLFTVYGPFQRPDMAIAKFMRRIREGSPIEMYGDGSTLRDYTYVDDATRALSTALDRASRIDVDFINVGGGQPVALQTLIEMIGSTLGMSPDIQRRPVQAGDVEVTHASIRRAQTLLDYRVEVPLDEGLRRYAEWMSSDGWDNRAVLQR